MATQNPFALLDGDDNDDPQALLSRVAAEPVKVDASKKAGAKGAKPAPAAAKPAAATTAPARSGFSRGGGRGGGRGGYGGRGGDYQTFNEPRDNGRAFITERQVRGEDGEIRSSFDQHGHSDLRRGGGRGGRGRGYGRDGGQRRPHREFDRMSGTGRGGEIKREGAGRGNWGREGEYLDESVAPASAEAEPKAEGAGEAAEAAAEVAAPEPPVLTEEELAAQEAARKEKEEEEKQMTLEEYEKVLEEKRKALAASKAAARVVELDEEMAKMTLKKKPDGDDVFVKLGAEKEKAARKKDEDRPKAVNINDFLKPAEGQTFHYRNQRGGGRGRGGGRYGGGGRGYGGRGAEAPPLDQSQFPTLA
ncbi:hypothetical protein CLOP_g12677 [Closterium sp. NIES-67]|nr:hypothetical protein CLOP_g12677 [Closterium sp. NIES-67]